MVRRTGRDGRERGVWRKVVPLLTAIAAGLLAGVLVGPAFGRSPLETVPRILPVVVVSYPMTRRQTQRVARALGTDLYEVRRAQIAFRKRLVPADAEEGRLLGAYVRYVRGRRARPAVLVVPCGFLTLLWTGALVVSVLDGDAALGVVVALVGLGFGLGIVFSWRRTSACLRETEHALAAAGRREEPPAPAPAAAGRHGDDATAGTRPPGRF